MAIRSHYSCRPHVCTSTWTFTVIKESPERLCRSSSGQKYENKKPDKTNSNTQLMVKCLLKISTKTILKIFSFQNPEIRSSYKNYDSFDSISYKSTILSQI